MKDKLALGFWNYQTFGKYDEETSAQQWSEMFMNLAASFEYLPSLHKPEQMLRLLDSCEKRSIKVLLTDHRVHWRTLQREGEEKFRKLVKEAVKDFGSHPASFAFFVGDEPTKVNWEAAKRAVQIVQELSPIPAFINFFPQWLGDDYEKLMGVRGEDYAQLLDEFIKETGLQFLAFDCYNCMNIKEPKAGLDMYFRNLNLFSEVAKKNHIPCWCSALCMGHWNYRTPSLHDMRWQVNTALAHGITGIQWFCMYEIELREDSWEDYPINFYGEESETCRKLRELNREAARKYGDIFPDLELERVFHYAESYGGTYFYYDGVDENLKSYSNTYRAPAVVSRFRHKKTGNLYYFFVNMSFTENSYMKVEFIEKYADSNKGIWLSPGAALLRELKQEK